MYKPLIVEVMSIYGFKESMKAMRLPMKSKSDSIAWHSLNTNLVTIDQINKSREKSLGEQDKKLARNLVVSGNDHAKALRGIIVYFKLKMQTGWMIEFETYRHGVECLSTSSSMHGELSKLKGKALAFQKQIDLPLKVYTRIVTISYQALRSMYKARRNHRHPDWKIFCDTIRELPHFSNLIYPEITM